MAYNTKKIRREINEILTAISDDTPDIMIYDAYDDYSRSMLEFIKTKNKQWFDKLFDVIDFELKQGSDEPMIKRELNISQLHKSIINHIMMIIFNDPDHQTIESSVIQHNESNEKESDPINIRILDCMNNFTWRNNQLTATNNQKAQGFLSGLHNQIMGAGKTLIILRTISDHLEFKPNKGLYIILCFRQEILRDMMFDEMNNIDQQKINQFRTHRIIDMDKFQIIDRVNVKEKKITLSNTLPTILIVNTDYFKRMSIDYNQINLVILDECHSVSAPRLYDELRKIKYQYKKHIIGFSATPLRKNAEQKLVDIFSTSLDEKLPNKKLNIISTYDFVNAIKDNVILPPKYIICEIGKTLNHRIGSNNKNVMYRVLKNTIDTSPYKKVIGWCRTIRQMREYYRFIKEMFPDLKVYSSSCSDAVNERQGYNVQWRKFIKKRNNCILLCVNRFREGSDIRNLDTAIYLDAVKSRSFLVAMQTAGRVLRKDADGLKTHGTIIDAFVNQDGVQVETMTAHRILSYYQQIFMLCEENDYREQIHAYDQMIELCKNMQYDEKRSLITIRLSENQKNDILIKLELNTKTYDFMKLKDELYAVVNQSFGVDRMTRFNQIIERLKAGQWFDARTVDFWQTYDQISENKKQNMELPVNSDILYTTYQDIFDNQTWFQILGIDTSNYYQTINECKIALKKFNIPRITDINYMECVQKDRRLPVNPNEYFKLEKFTDIEIDFNNPTNIRSIV